MTHCKTFVCLLDSQRSQTEEAPAAYSKVTIDTSHKVSDHYILQEKLGV